MDSLAWVYGNKEKKIDRFKFFEVNFQLWEVFQACTFPNIYMTDKQGHGDIWRINLSLAVTVLPKLGLSI